MADPVIRSFNITPARIKPGESATGTVDAYDPDNKTITVKAEIPVEEGQPRISATTTLTIEDNPIPHPVFSEVDAAGQPVSTPSLEFLPDPTDPFKVIIKAK